MRLRRARASPTATTTAFCARVLEWGRQAMANYKAPRRVVVVDALPLNASGKVLKRDLRDRFAAGGSPPAAPRGGGG